ncbi:MAG TPA: hypothetical protein VH061_09320 [Solirubrobacteraceae bacterium]|jgi:hypothetical protein|nr:hypothetical protein [Solirubrobacteraceae bacterium]
MKLLKARSTHRTILATVTTLAVVAAAAFAYWLAVNVTAEGETEAQLGHREKTTETVALGVKIPAGMTPGHPVPFQVFVKRSELKNQLEVRRLSVMFSNSAEGAGCSDSWFKLSHLQGDENELFGSGLAAPIVIKHGSGEAFLTEGGAEVELEENETVNQGACENATLHAKVVSEP